MGAQTGIAGLIANPASGKDIRRLVAHASVFGNDEKVHILRRVVLGLEAAGVRDILYMPDTHRLVPRALEGVETRSRLVPVDARLWGDAGDTAAAASAMQAAGARVIVSLGGDGTNRALAKGARAVPVVPISTGTNNVFPELVEGTVAGLAAGALASGAVDPGRVAPPCKCVEIALDGRPDELALIDAVALEPGFTASRALWEIEPIRQVVLTRAQVDAVGMSAVGGAIAPVSPEHDGGLHLTLGDDGLAIRAVIAPGLVRTLRVERAQPLDLGAPVPVTGPALLALDGERELILAPGETAQLTVTRGGPPVVDIARCLEAARVAGALRGDHGS